MKISILALVILMSNTVFAGDFYQHVICDATEFRPSSNMEGQFSNFARMSFFLQNKNGILKARSFAGMVSFAGYSGVFVGKDILENPYKRASTYQNHYRFTDFDAIQTFGAEDGMWGYFVINKDVENLKYGSTPVDGHYIFQAGDHMGGTVDFNCFYEED